MTETTTPTYAFSKPSTTAQISHDEYVAHLELERQQYLDAVDRIEKLLKISPTTAEMRRWAKRHGIDKDKSFGV